MLNRAIVHTYILGNIGIYWFYVHVFSLQLIHWKVHLDAFSQYLYVRDKGRSPTIADVFHFRTFMTLLNFPPLDYSHLVAIVSMRN